MGIKNAVLKEHEKILLNMLANSLFDAGREVNLNEDNLNAVWLEAYTQAVTLTAFQGFGGELPMFIRNSLNQTLADNTKIDFEHVRICGMMKNAGVRCTILKGYASALYYSDPLMRSMGDVDFLVDTDDFEKAAEVLNKNNYKSTDKNHDVHDVYFSDISRCEMHFQPSGIPDGKAGVKVRKYLSDLSDKSVSVKTELGEITVPSDYHHGLIILLHMCHHLTGDGLGLRHLCDWAVFLHKMGEAGFLEMFEETFKNIGLWNFAEVMTFISCEYLGLPEMSFAKSADKQLAEYILTDIIIGGNFGQKSADRSHERLFISSKNEKNVSMFRQFFSSANRIVCKNWEIAKKLPFLLPIGWLFFGLRYIIRSLSGKRPRIRPQKVAREASERIDIYSRLRLFDITEKL